MKFLEINGLINVCWLCASVGMAQISSPVKCFGSVPKISEGQYYYHDNNTKFLRVTTNVNLLLDLHQRSCFQVDIVESEGHVPDNSSADA